MRRSLIFHCYPKRGTNWREACLSTFKYREAFNGRLVISIVYGPDCDPAGDVVRWFEPFGPGLEFKIVPNERAMGLNTTFRDQLQTIRHERGIVFKGHTKGISHAGDIWAAWRNNMALGCLSDIPLVERKFAEGFRTFGVYKSFSIEGAMVMGQNWPDRRMRRRPGLFAPEWPGWHYPGAMFWFDPRFIPDAFFQSPLHHYENEAFPCHLGPTETGYALKRDNMVFISAHMAPFFAELQEPLCMF